MRPSDPVETASLWFWHVTGDLNKCFFEGTLDLYLIVAAVPYRPSEIFFLHDLFSGRGVGCGRHLNVSAVR